MYFNFKQYLLVSPLEVFQSLQEAVLTLRSLIVCWKTVPEEVIVVLRVAQNF